MRATNGTAALAALLIVGTAANAGQTKFEKFKFRVATDKKTYAAGAPVKVTFTVKNTDAEPMPLTFTSGQRYDITISAGTKTVWKWSRGRMFTQDFSTETLGVGKTWTYTEIYRPGTPTMPALTPGTYTVSAFLATTDKTVPSVKTTFKIAAGK